MRASIATLRKAREVLLAIGDWKLADEVVTAIAEIEASRARDVGGNGGRPEAPTRATEVMVMSGYDHWRHNKRPSWTAGPAAEVAWMEGIINAALAAAPKSREDAEIDRLRAERDAAYEKGKADLIKEQVRQELMLDD
jgi:hypothetical protein